MKTQLSRQQMIAVGIAVFGLVLGLGSYLILVAPQKSKAVALSHAVDAAQSSLYVLQHHPHVHVQKPKPPPVEATDLFRLTKAMPDSQDVPGILLSVMRLAKASSLELLSVQPPTVPPAQTPAGYTAVPVAIALHGKFADVASFLQRLRDSVVVSHNHLKVTNRLFVPSQISLSTADGLTVDASITLDAFVYGTPPPPVAPATGTTATTTTTSGGG
jgi:Tfp pilus assembly protein PilO